MKNKGFTLVELLSVIVVLAVIAIIASPIVLNAIKDAQEGAAERSAEKYLSAVKTMIAAQRLEGTVVKDGTYTVGSNGSLTRNGKTYAVEVNGDIPQAGGTIVIKDYEVIAEESSMTIGDYAITFTSKGEAIAAANEEENVDPIVLCKANATKATALVYKEGDVNKESSYSREEVGLLASTDGAYTPGVAYTCNFIDNNESNNMTFFVLSSTTNDVTLISGSNLGTAAWSADGKSHIDESEDKQAVTAKAALADRTSTWVKLNDTQRATIKIPTANQIAEAAGKTFDGTSGISGLPTWLYGYTKSPVVYGYWTATPCAIQSGAAWNVNRGSIGSNYGSVISTTEYGIRPVITISKSNMSL